MSEPFDSRMPVGDLPGWRQIFTERFDTPLALGGWKDSAYYKAKFRAYGPSNLNPVKAKRTWVDSSRHGVYMPEIISVENGMLTKHIHTDPKTKLPFVAALVVRLHGPDKPSGQLYGRYSIKMRGEPLPYYKSVPLNWPDSGRYLVDGEIDWPEQTLDKKDLHGFVHYTDQDTTKPTQQGSVSVSPHDFSVWHVYTMEWSPRIVSFLLNGKVVRTFTGDRIPRVPMHWVIQTETTLGGTPTPAPTTAGKLQVAWLAAWEYVPE